MFEPCRYKGKPAIFDTVSRVYYFCKSMKIARERCKELNQVK